MNELGSIGLCEVCGKAIQFQRVELGDYEGPGSGYETDFWVHLSATDHSPVVKS